MKFHQWQRNALCSIADPVNDVLLLKGTGCGKSLLFNALALMFDCLGLVVSPLNRIMENQVNATNARNVGLACDYIGGDDDGRNARVIELARCGAIQLLFVSPEATGDPRVRAMFEDSVWRTKCRTIFIDEVYHWDQHE